MILASLQNLKTSAKDITYDFEEVKVDLGNPSVSCVDLLDWTMGLFPILNQEKMVLSLWSPPCASCISFIVSFSFWVSPGLAFYCSGCVFTVTMLTERWRISVISVFTFNHFTLSSPVDSFSTLVFSILSFCAFCNMASIAAPKEL